MPSVVLGECEKGTSIGTQKTTKRKAEEMKTKKKKKLDQKLTFEQKKPPKSKENVQAENQEPCSPLEILEVFPNPNNNNNNNNNIAKDPWFLSDEAIRELEGKRDPEDDEGSPLQVGGNIPRDDFLARYRKDQPCHLIWEKGSVFITEFPRSIHERTARMFDILLQTAVPTIVATGSTTYGPPGGWIAEADGAYVPPGLPNPGVGLLFRYGKGICTNGQISRTLLSSKSGIHCSVVDSTEKKGWNASKTSPT